MEIYTTIGDIVEFNYGDKLITLRIAYLEVNRMSVPVGISKFTEVTVDFLPLIV